MCWWGLALEPNSRHRPLPGLPRLRNPCPESPTPYLQTAAQGSRPKSFERVRFSYAKLAHEPPEILAGLIERWAAFCVDYGQSANDPQAKATRRDGSG